MSPPFNVNIFAYALRTSRASMILNPRWLLHRPAYIANARYHTKNGIPTPKLGMRNIKGEFNPWKGQSSTLEFDLLCSLINYIFRRLVHEIDESIEALYSHPHNRVQTFDTDIWKQLSLSGELLIGVSSKLEVRSLL